MPQGIRGGLAAETAVVVRHAHVAQLSGQAAGAGEESAGGHDAGAYACAQRDGDEIGEASGGAETHLAQCGGIGVVGCSHGQPEAFAHEAAQGDGRLPGEVLAEGYRAPEVDVWRADAYGADGDGALGAAAQCGEGVVQGVDEIGDAWSAPCGERTAGYDAASGVDYAAGCVGAAYVDGGVVFLFHVEKTNHTCPC